MGSTKRENRLESNLWFEKGFRKRIFKMEGLNNSTEPADLTFAEIKKILRKFRENGTRNAQLTYKLGKYVCDNFSGKLGNEVWDVYEQMFFACIDLGINDI